MNHESKIGIAMLIYIWILKWILQSFFDYSPDTNIQ